ncbi:MAG: hypothetical protein AVDCRST_MAG19-4115, partial [uncultured Thermomicrobiales bacterium]
EGGRRDPSAVHRDALGQQEEGAEGTRRWGRRGSAVVRAAGGDRAPDPRRGVATRRGRKGTYGAGRDVDGGGRSRLGAPAALARPHGCGRGWGRRRCRGGAAVPGPLRAAVRRGVADAGGPGRGAGSRWGRGRAPRRRVRAMDRRTGGGATGARRLPRRRYLGDAAHQHPADPAAPAAAGRGGRAGRRLRRGAGAEGGGGTAAVFLPAGRSGRRAVFVRVAALFGAAGRVRRRVAGRRGRSGRRLPGAIPAGLGRV